MSNKYHLLTIYNTSIKALFDRSCMEKKQSLVQYPNILQ